MKLADRSADHTFEVTQDAINVACEHRPDTNWRFTDKKGHVHRWYSAGKPATSYNPEAEYSVPSLRWVKTGEAYYPDDDEPHDVGHNECKKCGEKIEPEYRADDGPVYIGGLKSHYVDGQLVTRDEFEKLLKQHRQGK